MQHAGLDQREVGEQRAHHGDLLHAAHQVEIGRVALVDDRRSGRAAGIDQHVDPIAAQRGRLARGVGDGQVGRGRCAFRGLLLAGLQEVAQVVADALLHRREIGRHVGQVLVLGQQVVDQVVDHHGGDLVVEVAQAAAELALPARHLQQHLLQLPLQRLDLVLEALLLFRGQLLELLGGDDLAVLQRGEAEAGGRLQQGQAALARLLLQLVEALFLALLELLLEGAAARRVLLALEGGREAGAQLFYQPFHVALQLLAHAGRQAQGARCGGLFEVVDVAPVVRGAARPRRAAPRSAG